MAFKVAVSCGKNKINKDFTKRKEKKETKTGTNTTNIQEIETNNETRIIVTY